MARSSGPTPFSIRMTQATFRRLESGARRRGEPRARTAERLIDEGLRMEDFPGIIFRDGPAGRRAALATGPDIWEVIETIHTSGLAGDRAVTVAAQMGNLTTAQVRMAVRYYAEFKQEVDAWIARNRDDADREKAAWERAQRAIE